MLLLIQHDDQITGLQLRFLVPFTAEHYLLSVRHAFVHMHLEDLPVSHRLAALFGRAISTLEFCNVKSDYIFVAKSPVT